jgi:lipopolysaccharide/colanic/teichoic acid biosynthesis glycosyltransferase
MTISKSSHASLAPARRLYFLVKDVIDRLIATLVLFLATPLLLVLVLLVYFQLGSPVFFNQKRPGQDGKVFTFYKFRTMANARNERGQLLPDEDRLVPLGIFLRKTSLDELPQLWNVVKGDISFVGPRPLLVEYLERYTPEQARRHEVKPGITGWAQVNGRNSISWEEKFILDVWYVDHVSIWLDLKILVMTVFKVLRREGISHANHSTMSTFMGSAQSSSTDPDSTNPDLFNLPR